jgi:hypothetical protein
VARAISLAVILLSSSLIRLLGVGTREAVKAAVKAQPDSEVKKAGSRRYSDEGIEEVRGLTYRADYALERL